MDISNKTIVVTGATSGIGREIVDLLSLQNSIIALGRNESVLQELEENEKISAHKIDLSSSKDVERMADEIVNKYPKIDVLINCAAVQNTPEFLDDDFSYELIKREIQINFTSICQLSYLLLPSLLESDSSTILNVNSGLGLAPKRTSAVYCGTKGALDIFSRSLSYQLEPKGIKVLQAFLPLVDTPMTKGRGSKKITSKYAAAKIVEGLENEKYVNDIGKVWLLRAILRIWPSLGYKIMKGN
jgi:uncharacterized oxidoreductase